MSCIHFKFKSSLDYEKVTFDGLHISLADLKDRIMKQKKIGLSNEFKLEVVDAQNKKGRPHNTYMYYFSSTFQSPNKKGSCILFCLAISNH